MKDIELKFAKHPFTLIIFGASGSLAKLKLFPALYELAKEKRLPKDYSIVGYARTPMEKEAFQNLFEHAVREHEEHIDEAALEDLLSHLDYFSGAYDEDSAYTDFKKFLNTIEPSKKRIRMAYFSVPPSAFTPIFKGLGKADLDTPLAPLRLIIEKPFGYDLKSAKALQKALKNSFKQDQIFLLDHYLGKEAVSNLLSLRYANSILSHLMNAKYVSNIQITAMEDRDIEGRANYFDQVGVLRDMMQSHLFQVLAYLTMNPMVDPTAKAIHREKTRILKSIALDPNSLVKAQYKGYLKEPGIAKNSQTETYAALKLKLKVPEWKDVPIYLRTGKALKQKWTAVVVEFKPSPVQKKDGKLAPNRLVIQIQPTEKIEFHLLTKLGGKTFDFHDLPTGRPIYCSGDCLSEHGVLLLDVIAGNRGLFLDFEEVFAAWKVLEPLQKKTIKIEDYSRGSLGPKSADKLLEKDGFEWFYSLPQHP